MLLLRNLYKNGLKKLKCIIDVIDDHVDNYYLWITTQKTRHLHVI